MGLFLSLPCDQVDLACESMLPSRKDHLVGQSGPGPQINSQSGSHRANQGHRTIQLCIRFQGGSSCRADQNSRAGAMKPAASKQTMDYGTVIISPLS